jgi:DNA modification methylase
MVSSVTCRLKAYIQPFERRLALAELAALAGQAPEPLSASRPESLEYRVRSERPAEELADRLTYWESVQGPTGWIFTTQATREATASVARHNLPLDAITRLVPFRGDPPLPNRRCLRYGTHGIHEYRGKYFPQLVRSLINIAGTPPDGLVADPMSGSGTTIVEALLAGCRGIGMDLNPLSVFMSRTKCQLLSVEPDELDRSYRVVKPALVREDLGKQRGKSYFRRLPAADREYLSGWFSERVLAQLDSIMRSTESVPNPVLRDFLRLAVSNILRPVSWQKVADLRIRKEVKPDGDLDPIGAFVEELGKSVRLVLAFLRQAGTVEPDRFRVEAGDARRAAILWRGWLGKVDAVITSPPYATALPYLDTDRLSLSYLGLLSRPKQRSRDQLMIGNREITEKFRVRYWKTFEERKRELPDSVRHLVERVETLNSQGGVGFRRRNLGALLGKYFLDMRTVLAGIAALLKPGRPAYVVVGNNRTVAGGEPVEINTASLLADLAETVGLKRQEKISMDMLVSRDIFRKNAMPSEVILCLRKPG